MRKRLARKRNPVSPPLLFNLSQQSWSIVNFRRRFVNYDNLKSRESRKTRSDRLVSHLNSKRKCSTTSMFTRSNTKLFYTWYNNFPAGRRKLLSADSCCLFRFAHFVCKSWILCCASNLITQKRQTFKFIFQSRLLYCFLIQVMLTSKERESFQLQLVSENDLTPIKT